MSQPRYDVALFDIDGTLCDPGTGITDAVAHALSRMGITEDNDAALRRFVGPPLEHSFRDYYGLDASAVNEAVEHYREHYRLEGLSRYRPYPGVVDLLERLSNHNVQLGVVTAKIQQFAEEALHTSGLDSFFDLIYGRSPQEVVTKTVTLAKALESTCAPTDAVVMIGDREHDIHAANDNGIESIAVLHGYGTPEELHNAGATYFAAGPYEIADIVLSTSQGQTTKE